MTVSALVSVATMEKSTAHQGISVTGHEVILRVLLPAPEPYTERRRSTQVQNDHNKIEGGERISHSPPSMCC